MKKVVVIDGQGGRMGALVVERLKNMSGIELCAIGTNSIATSVMLRAGAAVGATGENPVVVACRDADIIVGPIGIVIADSLSGEVTPSMALAVGASRAEKILLPVNRCSTYVVGTADLPAVDLVALAVSRIELAVERNT